MPGVQKTSKVCATCQYWEGGRQFVTKNVIHYDDAGICTASRSPNYRKKTRGMQSCGQWMKWVAIS